MNGKKFAGLIGMMLLSIVGITWVQSFWIRRAITIQNESFNNAVGMSLANAANTIESMRKMNFLNNIMTSDPLFVNNIQKPVVNDPAESSTLHDDNVSLRITNRSYSGDIEGGTLTTTDKSYTANGDSTVVSDSVSFLISPDASTGKINLIKKGERQGATKNPGAVRQNEFVNWLQRRSSEFKNLSDQMIMDIYSWERTFDLDKKDIDYALNQSFSFRNIKTPFEYAVIRDGVVKEGTFTNTPKKDFLKSNYKVRLFPDNIVHQDIMLSIVFPEKTNYVLGEMIWILMGSFLFSLFILFTFALSLYFIVRQKKISEMKSDFLNNMTHEFKTPIATISLAADTITNPKVIRDEASIRHFIGMIKKENARMNKKVETILQIASLDKKEIEFKYENVSLHSIIGHAIDTIDIQVQQRNGKIKQKLNAIDDLISGDSEHLTNLENNMLDNALK